MIAFIIRRSITGVVLLLAMVFVVFALFFLTPGDPARTTCGKDCTPVKLEQVRKTLGYDKPMYQQFGMFMKGLAVGRDFPVNDAYRKQLEKSDPTLITHCKAPCLGYSNRHQATVNALMAEAAPVTISLSIVSFVIWMAIGIPAGILAAVYKGRWLDKIIVGLALVAYSMPVFFVGILLLKFLAVQWQFVPIPTYVGFLPNPLAWFGNLVLPGVTLALLFMAAYVRITRAFVLESLTEDYIRTARAKGLKQRTVLVKHALRAAMTPLVTMAGLDFASLLAGAVITESVFTLHGLGFLAVIANTNSDLPVLIGLVVVAGAAVVVANIIVDVLYAYIDPRVRLG